MKRYNPAEIEPKWQKIWQETNVYTTDFESKKPKYIAMSMFNYPSGAGIHVGHAMNFTISDVKSRFKRQQGYESYNPVGWDSFGLPAENYAIKAGVSPQESMATIIPSYHKQYQAMGWSNDWEKEITTSVPEYYKWTQWIFSKMYEHGLVYQDVRMQWWCGKCQTVLANEQVTSDNKCWRHEGKDDPVIEKKQIKQWFFRITEYADEILQATDDLDWTESVKLAQKNWIGRSEGAEIDFALSGTECRSYIMGQKNISEEDIAQMGGSVVQKTEQGHLCVTFPSDVSDKYEELISKNIEPGFWNEYIGDDIVFIFKDKQGNVSRLVWSKDNEQEILELCEQYADSKFDSVESMLANNSWYAEIFPKSKIQNPKSIKVFTTRPDTLFGATFLVLAPEHEIVNNITAPEQQQAVADYIKQATKKTELERQSGNDKTGVFTGAYAINPANNKKIPIWIADYVLSGYGTGAIMAVPAHDERDNEFAQKYDLPIVEVVAPDYGTPLPNPVDVTGPVVVGYDPEIKQYMSLINTRNSKRWLVSGGLEPGETYEQAALRELAEEAGFHKIQKLIKLGGPTYSYFYNSNKDSNRRSFSYMYLAIINSSDKGDQALEPHEDYEVVWSDIAKIMHDLKKMPDGCGHWIDGLERAQKAVEAYNANQPYVGPTITDPGVLFASGKYDGLSSAIAKTQIVADLQAKGVAKQVINYKMRDWSVSRQRYWGAPIPMIYCQACGNVPVPEQDLPVILPELTDFKPSGDGRSALARAKDWLVVDCPKCGGQAERDTDTMDTYVCSSWYMLRYIDPHNQQAIFSSDRANKWMPIDFYNGGDHATAHLLYARFITRFFHKLGLLDNPEPFKQMLYNGKVTANDGAIFSKTLGNGPDPLKIIESGYGADSLRMYLMFAAPLELSARWDEKGVPGVHRFLSRLWNITQEYNEASQSDIDPKTKSSLQYAVNKMIKKTTIDLEQNRYNTAISATMECLNDLYKLKIDSFGQNETWEQAIESLLMCVAPFAPHISEELWSQLGHSDSIHVDHWPELDESSLQTQLVTIAVQVSGKLRGEIQVENGASKDIAEAEAKKLENVANHIGTSDIKKVIYIPNKILNFVV